MIYRAMIQKEREIAKRMNQLYSSSRSLRFARINKFSTELNLLFALDIR